MTTMLVNVLLLLLLTPAPMLATKTNHFYRLYHDLFESQEFKYNKAIRPATYAEQPTEVYLEFFYNALIDVNEKEQTLVSSGTLVLFWDDLHFSWDPAEYGNITSLLVPQESIYLPDVIVANSVRTRNQLGFPQQQVRLNSAGFVEWMPTMLLVTSCDIDITYFPFDTQICDIKFESAVSLSSEISLIKDGITKQLYLDGSPNGQWEVVSSKSGYFPASHLSGHGIRFGLHLKRRRIFYMLNIVLPVFFLSLTASLVFALPADEGEKVGTSITILLAFAVYLTIVSELVPNTSLQVSILGVYLTTLLGLSAISVVVCVFILRLHFRGEDIPVGPKTAKLTRFLKRLLCDKKDPVVVANSVVPIHDSKPTTELNGGILTWRAVAKTLDDFCFILFTLLSTATTLGCLLALSIGGDLAADRLKQTDA